MQAQRAKLLFRRNASVVPEVVAWRSMTLDKAPKRTNDMNTIGRNEELFDYMSLNKLYLTSSVLLKIDIFEERRTPSIELHFKLSIGGGLLKIRFTNVMEYSFYYKMGYSFYNVERCKFFKKGDSFYISLDPYDEWANIDENDQDFILCSAIEGYM